MIAIALWLGVAARRRFRAIACDPPHLVAEQETREIDRDTDRVASCYMPEEHGKNRGTGEHRKPCEEPQVRRSEPHGVSSRAEDRTMLYLTVRVDPSPMASETASSADAMAGTDHARTPARVPVSAQR